MGQNKIFFSLCSVLLLVLIFALPANSATVQRTSLIVDDISCTSCLAVIEKKLRDVPGTLGMASDLSSGRITVDHLPSLGFEQIAATISRLGYPATVDWTATLPEQYARRYSRQGSFNSGYSSGCIVPGRNEAGLTIWKAAPRSGTVSRTTLRVGNLSCSSCLNGIAETLHRMPETYGMKGYLSRGVVIVDHTNTFDNTKIAAAISALGYPVRILALNKIPAQKLYL